MSQNIAMTATTPVSTPEFGAYSQHTQFVDRHNYGYVLKRKQEVASKQEVCIATYHISP